MRESRIFGERGKTRKNAEVKKKYILFFEGTKTEPQYFQGIINNRQALGVSSLIQIKMLERCLDEECWSNPKKILDRVLLNLEEKEDQILIYSTLLNAIIDTLYNNNYLSKRGEKIKEIWSFLKENCENTLNISLEDKVENKAEATSIILGILAEGYPRIIKTVLENLNNALSEMEILYNKEIDSLCFIFDRDRKSFFLEQYNDVLAVCKKNAISIYPSNPCFDFWLLLHFDEVLKLDNEKILANEKISKSKNANTYVFHEFSKLMRNKIKTKYKIEKSKYNVEALMELIPTALENASKYCEEAEKLENQIGTSVGVLVRELMSKEKTRARLPSD